MQSDSNLEPSLKNGITLSLWFQTPPTVRSWDCLSLYMVWTHVCCESMVMKENHFQISEKIEKGSLSHAKT